MSLYFVSRRRAHILGASARDICSNMLPNYNWPAGSLALIAARFKCAVIRIFRTVCCCSGALLQNNHLRKCKLLHKALPPSFLNCVYLSHNGINTVNRLRSNELILLWQQTKHRLLHTPFS